MARLIAAPRSRPRPVETAPLSYVPFRHARDMTSDLALRDPTVWAGIAATA
jgi:hypothetical protein